MGAFPVGARTGRHQQGTGMDRKMVTEVLEYVATAVIAVLIALMLSDQIATPLWGGLSDARFR